MARRKEHSIRDVADMAGCSIGTVSRAFNGYEVSPAIKAQIGKAVEKLNYIPLTASKPSSVRGRDVLILVDDKISDRSSWTQMVLFNALRILGDFGYRSRIEFRNQSNTEISEHLRNADACIVWGGFKEELYSGIATKCRNMPIISYSREIPYENAINIFSKDKNSMRQLVSQLIASRHRKIGLVTYYKPKGSEERYKGFHETINAFDCHVNNKWIVADSDFQPSVPGYDSTMKILRGEHPTAIVYGADILALGGMEAIKRSGFRIPEDISVVSFDDLPESSNTFPPLTTMRLDTVALATLMVESLEKLLLGRSHDRKVCIERQLIQRESVGIYKT